MKPSQEACAHPCLEGRGLLESVGQRGDIADAGLIKWCGWEASIKPLATLGGLSLVPPFLYGRMQEGSLADL